MDMGAPHAGFVIAAYAVSLLVIAGLALFIMGRDRALRAEARRLEARTAGDDGRS